MRPIIKSNWTKAVFLDNLSGIFAFVGFIAGRLKDLPVSLIAQIFGLISFAAYLLCYMAWLFATFLYPPFKSKKDAWYGFAEFRAQFQASAIIGFIGTIICLAYPPLLVLGLWLYAVSNILWSIGEYHKIKLPPSYDKQNFSTEKQKTYFQYAALLTAVSVLSAIATTIIICFPPAALVMLNLSIVLGGSLSLFAFYYWSKTKFNNYPPDKQSPIAIAPHPIVNVTTTTEHLQSHYNSLPFLKTLWRKPQAAANVEKIDSESTPLNNRV